MRKPDTETTHIQIHGTDLAHLPFAGKLKWLIEFQTSMELVLDMGSRDDPQSVSTWILTFWPIPSSLSSSPAGPPSMASGPPSMAASPAAQSTFFIVTASKYAQLPVKFTSRIGSEHAKLWWTSTANRNSAKLKHLAYYHKQSSEPSSQASLFSQPASGPLNSVPHYRVSDLLVSPEVQQLK